MACDQYSRPDEQIDAPKRRIGGRLLSIHHRRRSVILVVIRLKMILTTRQILLLTAVAAAVFGFVSHRHRSRAASEPEIVRRVLEEFPSDSEIARLNFGGLERSYDDVAIFLAIGESGGKWLSPQPSVVELICVSTVRPASKCMPQTTSRLCAASTQSIGRTPTPLKFAYTHRITCLRVEYGRRSDL